MANSKGKIAYNQGSFNQQTTTSSFVRNPYSAPVFDRLQYAKTYTLQAIKTWSQGRFGKEAKQLFFIIVTLYTAQVDWLPNASISQNVTTVPVPHQLVSSPDPLPPPFLFGGRSGNETSP